MTESRIMRASYEPELRAEAPRRDGKCPARSWSGRPSSSRDIRLGNLACGSGLSSTRFDADNMDHLVAWPGRELWRSRSSGFFLAAPFACAALA